MHSRSRSRIISGCAILIGAGLVALFLTGLAGDDTSLDPLVFAPGSKAAQAREGRPTLWLLSVGISDYEDRRLELRYADVDAQEIAKAFGQSVHQRIYADVHTRVLTNDGVTRESVLQEMQSFLGQAGPEDVVAIFMAGHGVRDGATGTYYFLPYSATPENLVTTGLRMSDFNEVILVLRQNVGRVVLLLDTCYSGAFEIDKRAVPSAVDLARDISAAEGLYVLAAAKPGEQSQEDSELEQGVFTYALLEGLRGAADSNSDGLLSLADLFGYVARTVPRLTEGRQHPYSRMEGTDLVFAAVESQLLGTRPTSLAPLVSPTIAPKELRANAIAVSTFRNERRNDSDHDWFRTALQTAFATEITRVEAVEVYSPEAVEEAGTVGIHVARSLGAATLISGSFVVVGETIRIDARVVDVPTGMIRGATSVEGNPAEFFQLQKKLVLDILGKLEIGASNSELSAIAESNRSENQELAIDAYRLLLQSEGIDDAAEMEKTEGAEPQAKAPRHLLDQSPHIVKSWLPRLLVAAASAEEVSQADQVMNVLERYRAALEENDFEAIVRIRGGLTTRQRQGLETYFANASDLQIDFFDFDLRQVEPTIFAVSYRRRDRFADRSTGERVDIEIRMENSVVWQDGDWQLTRKSSLPVN